jgi:hypothetical protein
MFGVPGNTQATAFEATVNGFNTDNGCFLYITTSIKYGPLLAMPRLNSFASSSSVVARPASKP